MAETKNITPNEEAAYAQHMPSESTNGPAGHTNGSASGANQQKASKPRGPSKAQQLNKLYSLPAPLRTFPLPTFVPHNPLSLFHILYVWTTQIIWKPSSHFPALYQGYFSPSTRSVHVTEPRSIRGLWEQGFYGKGSLSRSEPSWFEREKRKGEGQGLTAEEATRQRRAERQSVKWERARKEREAIAQTLAEEAGDFKQDTAVNTDEDTTPEELVVRNISDDIPAPVDPRKLLALPLSSQHVLSQRKILPPTENGLVPKIDPSPARPASQHPDQLARRVRFEQVTVMPTVKYENTARDGQQEHFQLTLEEAFFLSYSLGALKIYYNDALLQNHELFSLFRKTSRFPPSEITAPDDEFVVSYVVYHHFRSLGWVVRGGTKFSVDYMLYLRGPVFTHAEFAVLILPSYSDPYWSSTEELQAHAKRKERRSWSWLHCINRVITQVKKTLILVYVDIPKPLENEAEMRIDTILERYKVREIVLKRWLSNRSRD